MPNAQDGHAAFLPHTEPGFILPNDVILSCEVAEPSRSLAFLITFGLACASTDKNLLYSV